MASRAGGSDRISTKSKLAAELRILGELLIAAREGAGLKQIEVVTRLGMPASYLSKIENGSRRLDVIELVQIAAAMNVDPGRIVRQLAERMAGKVG